MIRVMMRKIMKMIATSGELVNVAVAGETFDESAYRSAIARWVDMWS